MNSPQLIHLPIFDKLAAEYRALPMRPLRITAKLNEQAVSYHNLHFDSILSFAVVEIATEGAMLPNSAYAYAIPLPLKTLWESKGQLPLWACTDFELIGEKIADERYYHRRAIDPSMTTKNLRTTQGRHKEKRTPFPTFANREIFCDCIGHPETIGKLLSQIASVGKKRHSLGAIEHWKITEIDNFSPIDENRRARRPIPITAFKDSFPFDFSIVAYAPPYWHAASKATCVDTGQIVPEGCEL